MPGKSQLPSLEFFQRREDTPQRRGRTSGLTTKEGVREEKEDINLAGLPCSPNDLLASLV